MRLMSITNTLHSVSFFYSIYYLMVYGAWYGIMMVYGAWYGIMMVYGASLSIHARGFFSPVILPAFNSSTDV